MKRLLLATTILASVTASNSFAKTEGSYLGIDALSVRTSYYTRAEVNNDGGENYKPTQYGSTYGVGAHYGYAVNFNNFFIMPGIIFEQNSFGNTATKGANEDALKVKNRYGVKLDFGYDIGDVVSPYLTAGYAALNYKSTSNAIVGSGDIVTAINNDVTANGFFGAGMRFAFSKNVSMNVEYSSQRFMAKSAIPEGATYVNSYKQKGRLDTVKVGLSYNF